MRNRLRWLLLTLVTLFSLGGQTALALTQSDINDIVEQHPYFAAEQLCDLTVGCTCENGGTILNGSANAEKVWNFFTGSQGFTSIQAAGIMGNMKAEAGFEPRLVEYGFPNSRGETSVAGQPSSLDDQVPLNSNSKGQPGYGIVQWSGGRKSALAAFAQEQNKPASDLGVQLEFVMQELRGPYKTSTLDPLKAAATVEEAASIVLDHYEIPGNREAARPVRQNFAREFLTLYGSGTGIQTQSTAGSGSCAVPLASGNCPSQPVGMSETVVVSGFRIHPCISAEVERIMGLAKQQGVHLGGWGWRDKADQERLRAAHGCGGSRVYDPTCKPHPPTAVPGRSRHERGTAIDFTCNGGRVYRNSICFEFLRDNTSLNNLPSEPWHWSIDGA